MPDSRDIRTGTDLCKYQFGSYSGICVYNMLHCPSAVMYSK